MKSSAALLDALGGGLEKREGVAEEEGELRRVVTIEEAMKALKSSSSSL